MSKRPFHIIRDIFRKSAKDSKELSKFIFEKLDSISLWIIGLSLGAISAIASKMSEIDKLLNAYQTKTIFLILFISVVSGIFYRIFFVWYHILIDGAYRQIDISLSELDMVDTEFELNGNETFEELLNLNSQFQDLKHLSQLYYSVNEEKRKKLYDDMVGVYKHETSIAKQELELAYETVDEAYSSALGVKLNINERIINDTTSIVTYIRISKLICIILYFVCTVAFIIGLGYFLYTVRPPIIK